MKTLSVVGCPLPVFANFFRRLSQRTTDNGQRVALIVLLMTLALPSIANACPVCFGAPDSPMTRGTLNAVWFMIGIVALVQVGFVALFVGFWRRSHALKKFREQFHVVEGGMQ